MPTIAEIRQKAGGAYDDMSDSQLADGIYKKFYSDMPREQFDSKIGIATAAGPEKPFLEKLGNFARKVYENPPPTIAGIRDIIKGAPAAAQELTWGADPQAAEQAAGTMAGAAGLGLGFRGLGGEGVLARPIGAEARTAPLIPPRVVPPPTTSEQAVEAAGRGGYTLPSYVATEGTVIPQVASSVRNVPWAGQPITRTHDELIANMGRSAGEIAPAAGTPETAGERARTGLTAFIKTRSQEPVSEAYKAVDALIDPNVRVPLDNTREAIGQIMAERTRSRIPGQSKAVQTVFDAVQDPRGMDYAGTKGLRSFLGEKTPMELASQGLAPSEVKRIYGAMSRDLGNVVREAGGPEAFTAWKEANALTRLTKLQQQALSKVVGAEGDAAPEAVFNRLVTFANSRAGADLNRLRLAKQAMGPDAWNEVGSALIARLGKAPNEEFSPQRFMTAFGNMAPAARNELFSGRQLAALSDLFTVSKHIADRITRFGNPSGTARGGVVGQAITGGALFAEPISTLTTLVGARLAAEALSRPAVVRAATAVSRASLSGNPVATRRAIALLRAVAVREGLISAAAPQQQPVRAMAEGGRPFKDEPVLVGEQGPELFVPDRPGTIVPGSPQLPFRPGEREQYYVDSINGPQGYPDFHWVNPAGVDAMLEHSPESKNVEDWRDYQGGFAAAAEKTRRRYPTRTPDPASYAASMGGAAGWGALAQKQIAGMASLPERATQAAGALQRTGEYDPGPAVEASLLTMGVPGLGGGVPAGALGAGVGPLWHGISKIRLPRPVAEMTATHVPTGAIAEKVISPEAMQGGWLLPAWGDRSAAGSQLTQVGERTLRAPVEMQGGHGFMPANVEEGAAWASGKPVIGRLAKQTRTLAESGDPVYFPYTAMGERSVDFSHHMSDTLTEMIRAKPLSREAASTFDTIMREKDAKFPGVEDWPGLRSPKLKEYLANAPGDVRNKFAKEMDTAEAQALGLPSVAEARFAVTDPRLLDVPTGSAGQSVARLDPTGRVISNPAVPHRTYDTQLGGQYIGGLPQSVPRDLMFPDMINAYQRMGYEPIRHNYLMQRGVTGAPIAQRANQQWVDSISQYLEQARRRQGQ